MVSVTVHDWVERRWPYDSTSRRRARTIRRLSDAAFRARSLQPQILPAYWWDGHPNFGDALTPWVLARYGIVAVHTVPSIARTAGIGSIIEQLPTTFTGTIWGSGLLHGEQTSLPAAQYLAVRGPLTKAALGITSDIPLGDPGLLVARHARIQEPRWDLGLVPHGLHRDDPILQEFAERSGDRTSIVDVRSLPGTVIRQISRCAAVLTTSLHGLIVADALGVPALWTRRRPDLWGGDFKFRDYEAVMTPGRSREVVVAPDTTLDDIVAGASNPDQDARADSFRRLEETIPQLPATRGAPWLAHTHRQRKS